MLGSGVQDISCKVQNDLQIMYGCTLANNARSSVFYALVAYLRSTERRIVSQSAKKIQNILLFTFHQLNSHSL